VSDPKETNDNPNQLQKEKEKNQFSWKEKAKTLTTNEIPGISDRNPNCKTCGADVGYTRHYSIRAAVRTFFFIFLCFSFPPPHPA